MCVKNNKRKEERREKDTTTLFPQPVFLLRTIQNQSFLTIQLLDRLETLTQCS
jgi:hypothetical protein